MTTDPKTLIEKYPLTAEACKLDADMSRHPFSLHVRDYAWDNKVGDFAFDSVEQLMQAIEAHLAASRPKPLTEEDVAKMRWSWLAEAVGPPRFVTFRAANSSAAMVACDLHNAAIDRLWSEVQRLAVELEAGR